MQSSFKRFCITGVCCLGVLFEFWNYPPFNVINAEKAPQAYYWLKSQPADIILAEYPLDLGSPSEMYKMYQMTHQKKMINFIVPGSAADKNARQLTRLSDYSTVQRLKEMGVSYVFVHRSAYERTELTVDSRELAMIRENPGLRYLRSFPAQGCLGSQVLCIEKSGPIDVYEIKLPNTSR